MKAYILSVLGCVFLLDIVSLILPSGKIGKSIVSAFRLVAVACIFSPLFSLVKDFRFSLDSSDIKQDLSVNEKLEIIQIERLIEDNFSLSVNAEICDDGIIILGNTGSYDEDIRKMIKIIYGKEVLFDESR